MPYVFLLDLRVQIGRKGASGQIGLREIYGLIFLFLFPQIPRPVGGFWCTMAQNTMNHTSTFLDPQDGKPHLGERGSNFSKTVKIGMIDWLCKFKHLNCARTKNDVIDVTRCLAVNGCQLIFDIQSITAKRIAIYCKTAIKNAKSLFPSKLTQTN